MCGITGWVDWERDLGREGESLSKMARTLTPRGPDDFGAWASLHAGFAHRRLVVIDPVGGKQPMVKTRGDNTYVLCYNGELYNTQELRSELQGRGYAFDGYSDTEVLLTAYMEWGKDCLPRLNGIFAFAVWSEQEQSLFLARDRLGVKPLFYSVNGSSLLFASEIKALLANPLVPAQVDAAGLAEIFYLGPARTPGAGVFKGIQELRPGCCLRFNPSGLTVERYWSLTSSDHPDNLDTTVEKVRELFIDSVRRQLVSDLPLCTLLSGGLDSSAITAIAATDYRERGLGALDTFSVDYAGNDRFFQANEFQPNSDSYWIGRVSKSFSTRQHSVEIDIPQLVDALEAAVRARDLPGMADIDSSLLLFCREIKQHSTVALSGECADEIFGGYPWFRHQDALDADTFPWSLKLRERINIVSPDLLSAIEPEKYVAERYQQTLAEVPRLPGENPLEARMREMFYLNFTWFMSTLLDRKDRMSMACGLEVRVPFCDHRLVEYVWNVPWSMKYHGQREKALLRLALTGILPEDVLQRRKSPYPKTHNPAYLTAVRGWLLTILNDPSSPILPLIDKQKVLALASAIECGAEHPWFGQLMTGPQLLAYLIQINTWLKEYRVVIK